MIEVNNFEKSYLGKEIREWCMNNPDDPYAADIKQRYYSDEAEYKPSDKVYYLVRYISESQSYKECGSLNMSGCRLLWDMKKSPRKYTR